MINSLTNCYPNQGCFGGDKDSYEKALNDAAKIASREKFKRVVLPVVLPVLESWKKTVTSGPGFE